MANIKATIFFDKRYWVGTFERTDKEGYAIAKHIFGAEPADPEVLLGPNRMHAKISICRYL